MKKRIEATATDGEYREYIAANCLLSATGCWEWQKATRNEYGQIHYRGKRAAVHRTVYRLWVGEIPAGMDVCHHCDNPRCCNPDHLWVGSRQQNALDMVGKSRHRETGATHCPSGHEFTPENTYVPPKTPTHRICRKCRNAHKTAYLRRLREVKNPDPVRWPDRDSPRAIGD